MTEAGPTREPLAPEARERALRDLQSGDFATVNAAAKLLSDDHSTTEQLLHLLPGELRVFNRHAILYALSWHAQPSTWPLMLRILSDANEHPKVRGQAAEAISYMYYQHEPETPAFDAAVQVLVEVVHDPSPEVRYCAANTIGASGYLPLVPVLVAMLEDHTPVPGWVGTVADEAARALEWIERMSEQRRRRRSKKVTS